MKDIIEQLQTYIKPSSSNDNNKERNRAATIGGAPEGDIPLTGASLYYFSIIYVYLSLFYLFFLKYFDDKSKSEMKQLMDDLITEYRYNRISFENYEKCYDLLRGELNKPIKNYISQDMSPNAGGSKSYMSPRNLRKTYKKKTVKNKKKQTPKKYNKKNKTAKKLHLR